MKFVATTVLILPLVFVLACQDAGDDGGNSDVDKAIEAARLRKAQIQSAGKLIHICMMALETYRAQASYYPTQAEGGLYALIREPENGGETRHYRWNGPYLDCKTLKDPWGNELRYEPDGGPDGRGRPRIWSYGPNGEDDGGKGDDIRSWQE